LLPILYNKFFSRQQPPENTHAQLLGRGRSRCDRLIRSEFLCIIEDFPPAVIRERIGMTQVEFAEALGIPVATLRNWEQGRVRIDPAARALFRILSRDPKRALNALKPVRKAG
jgi:ribosome-binding protein aMBF1 (putative translation factor)